MATNVLLFMTFHWFIKIVIRYREDKKQQDAKEVPVIDQIEFEDSAIESSD